MSTLAPVAVPLTAAAVVDGAMGTVLDSIVEVERLMASLSAYRAVAIDELHRLALAAEGPARSGPGRPWSPVVAARRVAASELAAATRISEREAEQLVADSASLVHELPATLDSLRSGRLSYRHASILIDEVRTVPAQSWPAFEAAAVPEAEARTPGGFRQRARAVRERLHPDSIADRRRAAEESRSVQLETGRDGMAWLTAHLPAEQAIGAYRRLTEMASSLGAPDEPRTLAQRRADVFADLLLDGMVSGSGLGRGVRASVLVTVPVLSLLDSGVQTSSAIMPASLEGYGPISGDVARRLAAHAPSFVRLLTHPENGTVLSVGRERYAVPRDLKLWLRIRDETCRFPGCGRAAVNADLDHTVDWQHEGATRHDNLAHLCEAHHRLKHQTAWRVNQAGGGALEWLAPSGRAYRTEPAVRLAG
ncbi:HNH endonuclease signature motif containing protein [Microcella sp.]|uniref:HNH endonuclease signature motif containing protein n=1 Tax=Microcella sp. TaxID=1913979 RepID=UPI00255DD619|nr:HNH endonuclease signature motif containing protein [Microcella sp.]MBX9472214.1 HNH endonuclease [Microcella sp.]